MHTRILAVSALVLSLASGSALAAEVMSGKVESYDPESRVMVLDTGESFVLAPAVETENLDEGDEVMVSFDMVGDDMVANEVEISE